MPSPTRQGLDGGDEAADSSGLVGEPGPTDTSGVVGDTPAADSSFTGLVGSGTTETDSPDEIEVTTIVVEERVIYMPESEDESK